MEETQPLSIACPDCAAQMPENAAFCPSCGQPMQALPRAQGKVGRLPEPIAGALAYLTFIPAVIFLLSPPYKQNRFVRFHAFQCLFFWLGCAAFAAALRLAAIGLILVRVVGPLLVTLLGVIASIATVMVWVVLEVKALQGDFFHLPGIGGIAATYADKA